MGCTGAVSNPFIASPYVNFTTVSDGGCFSQSESVNGVHVYLAVSVSSTPFPRSHVLVFSCLPHDLTSFASVCGLTPPCLGHLVCLGHLRFKAS